MAIVIPRNPRNHGKILIHSLDSVNQSVIQAFVHLSVRTFVHSFFRSLVRSFITKIYIAPLQRLPLRTAP